MSATFPAQYYNRFDASKRYKQLLFRAARGLQSAELNEMHATLQHELSTIANSLLGDGSLLRGGSILRQGTTNTYNAETATFYALGYTHTVPANSFTVGGLETVSYGIALLADVVSENEDPALRDPALNTRNFNEPGAHRLRYTARWCKESEKTVEESFYSLVQFVDGERLTAARTAVEATATTDLIARLDYESNGSYVIDGMVVSYLSDDTETKEHILNVAAGSARVEGYERILDFSQRLRTSFALDTRSVSNEPLTFTADGEYALRWSPIAQLSEVNGIKEIVATVTHGNFTGVSDLMVNTPVVSIIAVNQGGTWNATTRTFSGGTTYTVGTDFIVSGDRLDWSPTGGAEPAPGSTYTVVYRYSAIITPTISTDRKKITVTGLAPNTVFYVDYTHYIPRYDVVVMARDGQLTVLKGTPDYLSPMRPTVSSGLQLASIYISYGANPVVTSDFYRAYKFSDIFQLEATVQNLQLNVATLSLRDQINATDPTVTKRGTFVDSFQNDAQRDAGISQNAAANRGVLYPNVTWTVSPVRTGNLIRLPFAESTLISQTAATKTRLINAYGGADLPPALVTITPQAVRWVTATIVNRVINTNWVAYMAPGDTTWNGPRNSAQNVLASSVVTTSTTTETVVEAVIPPTTITITASKFNANEPVQIVFDGTLVKTANANAAGVLTTTFQTPEGALSGVKPVVVLGTTSQVTGRTAFTATPVVVRVIDDVTDTIWYDPLAQTFASPDSREYFISSIDLQFGALPAGGQEIEVAIVEVQLGIPNRERRLAQVRVPASALNTTPGVWTTFTLPTPVRVLANVEYAFIVLTASTSAAIRVAELGQYDASAGRWIARPAYEIGVLLESANQSSWSPLPKEDATFRIKRATFSLTSTVNFTSVNAATAITDVMLLAGTQVLPNTSVQFSLAAPATNATYNLTPYNPLILTSYTGALNLSAKLASAADNISPSIDGNVFLALGVVQLPATYVTRAIPIPASTTGLQLYLDVYEPSAASITVYYRNQADTAWVEMPRVSANAVSKGNGVVEMPFAATVSGLTSTRLKISMTTTDAAQRPAAANLRMFFI